MQVERFSGFPPGRCNTLAERMVDMERMRRLVLENKKVKRVSDGKWLSGFGNEGLFWCDDVDGGFRFGVGGGVGDVLEMIKKDGVEVEVVDFGSEVLEWK